MIKAFYPRREFSAYLFDFDGTVADTMPAHHNAWNKALSLYGLSLSPEQHQEWAGRPTREIVRLLNELHNVEMSVEQISQTKESHYLNSLVDVTGIVPIVEIIRSSYGKIPMAVVSGSRHRPVEETLKHLKMTHFFDALVCAEDYVNGKPAPDCFLKAADLLGVEPENCLVFEDANLGIQAARAANMACLRVTTHPDLGHQLAHITSDRDSD